MINLKDWSRSQFLELSLPVSNLLANVNDLTSGPEFKYEYMSFNGKYIEISIFLLYDSLRFFTVQVARSYPI